MISNQVLQNTVEGLKTITKVELCIFDIDGNVLASTSTDLTQYDEAVKAFVTSPADSQTKAQCQFLKIFDEHQLEYVLIAEGEQEDVYMISKVAGFQLQNLLVAYKERFDKDNFVKNLLLDNLLLVDIYNRAKKLHIKADVRRVIYILEIPLETTSNLLFDEKNSILDKSEDFIAAVDEKNSILVKALNTSDEKKEMSRIAYEVQSKIEDAGHVGQISYGTIVGDIKEVSKSYKEAKMALDIGKIFFGDRKIVAYSELGIGRLIYQLPIPLCRMFINEIFSGKSPDEFDEETLVTIDKFFENSLNVSETSRQLYIHRNTLVYRLDKLQKSTGLDLRVFEDAITFKIALMVVKYMKYMEETQY